MTDAPLTLRTLVRGALAAYRADFLRIALAAIAVFVPLGFAETYIEEAVREYGESQEGAIRLALLVATLVSTGAIILGQTFYAGLLDRLVGARLHGQGDITVWAAVRTLPYGRLIAANLAVAVLWVIGLLLFVIPGVVVATLLCIVGPVVNVEGLPVLRALRRSARLVRPRFWLAFFGVTVPLTAEDAIDELVNEVVWDAGILSGLLANGGLAVVVGATVGLFEVILAHELISRYRAFHAQHASPQRSEQAG